MGYMVHSKALLYKDFESEWYKRWAKKLKQTSAGRGNFALNANKFWQNAIMAQMLYERGVLKPSSKGLGFGVGMERLPALFASLGVHVTATDQDFSTSKAASWKNGQLAIGTKSLNIDRICSPEEFSKNIDYKTVDMTKVPDDLEGQYDFLWSNCALGHLGSIDNGLDFISDSLKCLVPGGWAVHTTEADILSNRETLETGDTVFFRQKDLLRLFLNLSKKGYIVDSLNFKLAEDSRDQRFTLFPEWGSDFSNILFNGYMATQIVILVHKPYKINRRQKAEIAKHRRAYLRNLKNMRLYLMQNRELAKLLKINEKARQTSASQTKIIPLQQDYKLRISSEKAKDIFVKFRNESSVGVFKQFGCLHGTLPVSVATHDPINRPCAFTTQSWHSNNRPDFELLDLDLNSIEYVKPNQGFLIKFTISANKLKSGKYAESFCLVKDGDGVIPSTYFNLSIDVRK